MQPEPSTAVQWALSRVLAARTALTTPSTALGTLLGGPAVTALGGRPTLLLSALLTIALGVVVAAVSASFRGQHGCGSVVPADMLVAVPNRVSSRVEE